MVDFESGAEAPEDEFSIVAVRRGCMFVAAFSSKRRIYRALVGPTIRARSKGEARLPYEGLVIRESR